MNKIAFVDTSVILRRVLGEKGGYEGLDKFEKLYASEILRIEALRVIDRLRIQNNWPEKEVALRIGLLTAVCLPIQMITLQSQILRRAGEPFPTLVRTLDAIHIATALLAQYQIDKPIIFLTHDREQGIVASAAGLQVV